MQISRANIKTALVLSGGGAYGAYEAGIVKALYAGDSPATEFTPLDADVLTGTSVGSYNAAVLAMNTDGARASALRLEKLWTTDIANKGDGRGNGVYRIRSNPADYLDPMIPGTPIEQLKRAFADANHLARAAGPRIASFFSSHSQLLQRTLGLLDVSAFINTSAFAKLVETTIDPRAIRSQIAAKKKALRVTATNWNNGNAEEFDFLHMTDEETWAAIRASAAIPGLFPTVDVGDETFVDGGVVMNTPIKPAVEEKATELHVVSLDPTLIELGALRSASTLDTFDRVYTAMLANVISEDIETARWVNEGIEIFERADKGETVNWGEAERLMRVAGQLYRQLRAGGRVYQPLTIHRYYPAKTLGGLMGMLDFDEAVIVSMMKQGYQDACAHSCAANGCVIPESAGKSMTAGSTG
jgi:predicted acylesterase/phospholipase RssA